MEEFLASIIKSLVEMEQRSCSMEVMSAIYIARMLNVPLEEVEVCLQEMGFLQS